ncbi:MAG: M23 family metallopeptidase [Dehalococcoidia bacterium]
MTGSDQMRRDRLLLGLLLLGLAAGAPSRSRAASSLPSARPGNGRVAADLSEDPPLTGLRGLAQPSTMAAAAPQVVNPPLPLPVPTPGPGNTVVPFFSAPFSGAYPMANPFDHQYPFEFQDTNGVLVTWWGDGTSGIDGHSGYDGTMQVGTPILAVAPGKVTVAGQQTPFFCPPLNMTVFGNQVIIQHTLPDGQKVESISDHLSEIDTTVNSQVVAGQQIGLSGNTGCSTGPHLHFQVDRLSGTNTAGRPTQIDPYGWEGSFPDPWASHPQGAASIWLWKSGQAPPLNRETDLAPGFSGTDGGVALTAVRWLGVRDDQNPNNEFVQLTEVPGTRVGSSLDLTGYSLQNNRGES